MQVNVSVSVWLPEDGNFKCGDCRHQMSVNGYDYCGIWPQKLEVKGLNPQRCRECRHAVGMDC